jgi:hypothetical protein
MTPGRTFDDMNWNRSETIALASEQCTVCHGGGLRYTPIKGKHAPCNCVLRSIFRACYARFRDSALKEKQVTTVSWQYCESGKGGGRRTWGRRDEEYVADFCLIARRTLTDFEHQLFRFHFLLGADWRLCCRRLGMDRGLFFHSVYRIQQKLGLTFRELQPYALFPLDEYFGGKIQKALPCDYEKAGNLMVLKGKGVGRPRALQPPLRQVA